MISLTLGKVYEVFEIEHGGQYRLIDNTMEDYLFPAYMFEPLDNQVLDEELKDRFPFRFGPKLKQCGVLLNDPSLGKWHDFTIWPFPENRWKMLSYEEAWQGFFTKHESIGRTAQAEEIRRFAYELAQHFGIEWEVS